MKTILTLASLLLVTWLAVGAAAARQQTADGPRYAELREEGERLFAEGSYALALEVYERCAKLPLSDQERRWVSFRGADCRWRSAAATDNADQSELQAGLRGLMETVEAITREEDRDRVWAEAQESLGDYHWLRDGARNFGGGWNHYQLALQWWARSSDLDLARTRYLQIVRTAARPPWYEPHWNYGAYGNRIPRDVLRNVLEIAVTDQDRAQAHFMLGVSFAGEGRSRVGFRALEEFAQVMAFGREGPAGDWYDDALYQRAVYLESYGVAEQDEDGNETWAPDYVTAAEHYRRLLREFRQGETRFWREAQQRLKGITSPQLNVSVERFFLPGSEAPFSLSWRNVSEVELALYAVDLTRDPRPSSDSTSNWLESIPLANLEPIQRWQHSTEDTGEHLPGNARLVLEDKPALGAYVLHAKGAGLESRALVLVSSASLTVKASGQRLLAWLTDVQSGEPLAQAKLRLWQRAYVNGDWRLREVEGETKPDGTRLFELGGDASNTEYFLAARSGASQTFVQGNSWSRDQGVRGWRMYAFTDRPAYRPGDLVQWKVVARVGETEGYQTPADQNIHWQVRDPRGNAIAEGEGRLNAFGSLWADLETDAKMTLGEYQVQFEHVNAKGNREHIGQATLFRLEEYKLPEFEVSVSTPKDENDRPRVYTLGDEVSFDVEGTYYFGGPVGGAEVEVFVYQKPLYFVFPKRRDFPWLYEEQDGRQHYWGGPGQQVLHQKLRTDVAGRARLTFETPAGTHQDLEYTIEARVVDDSRREIVGRHTVRVTAREYQVELVAEHAIHTPDSEVELEVRARDANDGPVSVEGRLGVYRERWIEIWTDPSGREVRGEELARLKREGRLPPPGQAGWQQIFGGYEKEMVAETRVTTDAEGMALWRFRPARDGHYRVAWKSRDSKGTPIAAETRVFVADEETRELGYLAGGVELVVDKDTFVEGEAAAVVLLCDASGRWVLFTAEAGELLHHEVVHLEGTARLLRLPIDASHVPNVWLGATMIHGGTAYQDFEEVVVPPTKSFLDVDVAFSSEAYEPGSEGELLVTVRDHEGRPVATELALGVSDDALSYIQSDYAADPRRFFYGERRWLGVSTQGSFHHGRYAFFEKDDNDEVGAASSIHGGKWGFDDEAKEEGLRSRGNVGEFAARKSAAAPMAQDALLEASPMSRQDGRMQAAAGPSVRVRSDFRDTALWLPDVQTDAQGRARVQVPFPDSTTRWNAVVRAADRGARFGMDESSARTRLPLIVRLQTPRFFQVGDECIVSANVNNNTDGPAQARVTMAIDGLRVLGRLLDDELVSAEEPIVVSIPAGESVRVDWRVRVDEPGTAVFELAALAGETGDALRRELPIHPHGIEALLVRAGKLEGDELAIELELPPRSAESTSFEIQLTPSLAVTMLDALPYLVDYPYGCTEQTLSRFLPSVVVTRTLRDLGLSPKDAMSRVFGGIEAGFADEAHPKGKGPLEELNRMTAEGLARLYDFQHGDGGWSWWKAGDSDPFMTAYVVWGLSLARDAGLDVRSSVLENGARWLALHVVEMEQRPDMAAWLLHALATYGQKIPHPEANAYVTKAFERLYAERARLNAYTRALLTLAAVGLERGEEARVLVRNLANGAELDRSPDTSMIAPGGGASRPYVLATAHWGNDGIWHRWSEGAVESTAFVLRALLAVDPDHELVEPTMNWLVKNRRGAQWSNTRDTAIVVLALNEYLQRSGELGSAGAFDVLLNGELLETLVVTPEDVLRAPSVLTVAEERLRDGPNEVVLRRRGGGDDEPRGPLYFAVHARFFSLEEPIPARGNEVFVRRDYYQLLGRPTLLAGTVFERVPLREGDTIASGTRVEVVLTIEAKNDLEYMLFEDFKPAGFEAVAVKSGEPLVARELMRAAAEERFANDDAAEAERRRRGLDRSGLRPPSGGPSSGTTGRSRHAHQELREQKVAIFVDRLADGFWELRYDLRAEVPGRFHALPLSAHAMYAPEIRANGAELRLEVLERGR